MTRRNYHHHAIIILVRGVGFYQYRNQFLPQCSRSCFNLNLKNCFNWRTQNYIIAYCSQQFLVFSLIKWENAILQKTLKFHNEAQIYFSNIFISLFGLAYFTPLGCPLKFFFWLFSGTIRHWPYWKINWGLFIHFAERGQISKLTYSLYTAPIRKVKLSQGCPVLLKDL